MARAAIALLALLYVAGSLGESEHSQERVGVNMGAKFWRVYSVTKTGSNDGWQLAKMGFFTSADGSGTAAAGKYRASSFKNKETTAGKESDKTHAAEAAFDGSEKTWWQASSNDKDEWVEAEFPEPQNIQSIKMQLKTDGQGPSAVIVEKSSDGENWALSQEIPEMRNWATKEEHYAIDQMDQLPKSLFALRSMLNPSLCIGVRPTPIPDDEDAEPIPIKDLAAVELQQCNNKATQFWSYDEKRGLLSSAHDTAFILDVTDSKVEAGAAVRVKRCIEGCAEMDSYNGFAYHQGFMHKKEEGKQGLVISVTGGEKGLKPGSAAVLDTCGKVEERAGDSCKDKPFSLFELFPMFRLEPGVQAINCSPYSHMHKKPDVAKDRTTAQEFCAKDSKCIAYNWASDQAEAETKDKAWACYALHDVHKGVNGFELGMRMGTLNPGL